MDVFFEKLVVKKKTGEDTLVCIGACVGAFIAILAIMAFIRILLIPAIAVILFVCYRIITGRNLEYEYSVTDGDLNVDKVINKQRRKKVINIPAKSIKIVAPRGDSRLPSTEGRDIIDVTSRSEGADVYCVFFGDGKEKVLLFEPDRPQLEEMQRKNPRNVFI